MNSKIKHSSIKFIIDLSIVVFLVFTNISNLFSDTDARLKDLINIKGYRTNQLVGLGLVVGLSDTGDSSKSLATNTVFANMLNKLGLHLDTNKGISSKNIATVIVTADMPTFKKNGDKLDVKVSAIGDASDLSGGELLSTYLKAQDGEIYAVAQGSIVNGSRTELRSVTLPDIATIEKEFIPNLAPDNTLSLSLKHPDFTTASKIRDAINLYFKGFYAKTEDPSGIKVSVPLLYQDRLIEFISELENLKVSQEKKARIVFNEKAGTIVIGSEVKIDDITITHNGVNIEIKGSSTVGDFIKQANSLGLGPKDLIAILQSIHAAGAISADLQFL